MNCVSIYAANISNYKLDQLFSLYSMQLTEIEKAKVNSFRFEADSLRAITAILLLKSAICTNLKIKTSGIVLEKNANGKPFLKGHGDFHFNISHSGDWVLLALSDKEIGIDIEKIEPVDLHMIDSYFSKKECEHFNRISEKLRLDYFFELWTLKESYIKYLGTGLSLEPVKFTLTFDNNNIKVFCADNFKTTCKFMQIPDFTGYKAALCRDTFQDISYKINYVDISQLNEIFQ